MYRDDRIVRLLNYKNLLYQLKNLGFVKVFSDNIADSLSVSSSLVRKDFNIFGIKGNQKGGYHIDTILEVIHDILGKSEIQKVVLVGVGRIGEALFKYNGFQNEGIRILAGFDIDTRKLNDKAPVPVYPIDQLSSFIIKNNIKIAIMAVPDLAAQQTVELLKNAGIKGILNFSSVKLKSSPEIQIRQINIEHELENLIYQVKNLSVKEEKKESGEKEADNNTP